MFDYIKGLFAKKYRTGVIPDNRLTSEKQQDYLHEEIALGPIYSVWGLKTDAKKYVREDQNQTESCVTHAYTLAMGIDNELEGNGYVRLSKTFMYKQRSNYPASGMILSDVGNIGKDQGSCLFNMSPTPTYEYQFDQVSITQAQRDNAQTYKEKNYVSILNYNDIEVLNSVASQGKGVVVLIYATKNDWAKEYPTLNDNVSLSNAPIRHAVCVLPHSGFIENGIKYVMIQDSVSSWGTQYRCLSEAFIRQRCYGAVYPINLPNQVVDTKPHHLFTIRMKYGDNNDEVAWLQKCLIYEGLFAGNATGFFGGITLKAVNNFQNKYAADILIPNGLTQPTGIVGDSTIKKLNQLYAN